MNNWIKKEFLLTSMNRLNQIEDNGNLHFPVPSMNKLNQTEAATFSILLCWTFFRDPVFLYFVANRACNIFNFVVLDFLKGFCFSLFHNLRSPFKIPFYLVPPIVFSFRAKTLFYLGTIRRFSWNGTTVSHWRFLITAVWTHLRMFQNFTIFVLNVEFCLSRC
jgi:hypothetical protein